MRFRAKVELIMFQKKQFRKIYLNALENVNERAGQAWIAEAIDNTPIPTWSGASRATFEKLASELGTSVMYGPQRSYKDRRALGRSTSAGSGVVRKMDGNNVYIGFAYETDLRYLAYNEYNRAVPGPEPQPWSNNVGSRRTTSRTGHAMPGRK